MYVRSESISKHQQAAQQALHDHCKPLLESSLLMTEPSQSETTPSMTPGDPNQTQSLPAHQLALVKPCAWPFPVTASHFADDAALATLARDAALWESYCAKLAAGPSDQQHVLQLMWKAAACFAERASNTDRKQRQQWSALTAAHLQASCVASCPGHHESSVIETCLSLWLQELHEHCLFQLLTNKS